jgi:hypothetical protein
MQNFWVLTVPVRTVRTVTWQGRTISTVTWQVDDMAHFYWLMLMSHVLTRVRIAGKWDEDTWPNLEAPRVPFNFV